jgi:hypothetical protein
MATMQSPQQRFKSSDGVMFTIDCSAAMYSSVIRGMLEDRVGVDDVGVPDTEVVGEKRKAVDGTGADIIPLPFTAEMLEIVFTFLRKHHEFQKDATLAVEMQKWESEFLKVPGSMSENVFYTVVQMSDFLDIPPLKDLWFSEWSHITKGLDTPEKMRSFFNLPDDLTKEQKEAIENEKKFEIIPYTP